MFLGCNKSFCLPFKQKYPIIWQGHLALKNDTAAVQLHFVSGNNVLAHRSLPPPEGGSFLRIAQRMRLEASQLEGVARRMTVSILSTFIAPSQTTLNLIYPYLSKLKTN